MASDASDSGEQYDAAYRGTRDAFRTVVAGVVLCLVGVVGAGLLRMTVLAVGNDTATWTSFAAGLFGAAAVAFAAYELYYL